ncbi:MAG: alpha/beta hydrolase family esterase [Candidatus Cryptobacteroides sp.]
MMKTVLKALVSCAVLFCSVSVRGAGSLPDGVTRNEIRHKGMTREYLLYLPDNLKENAPLVLVLHGYGGRAMIEGQKLYGIAKREGFALCYPQGAVDGRGKTCWNVGYPFQEGLKTDDVDFILKLARHLQKTYGLSRENTFLTGISNGGEMCYLMAYLHPDFFGAVAPIAGLTMEWMRKELDSKGPVPLMEVHGTNDTTSEWEGDPENKGGWGAYISVPLAVGKWACEARCSYEVTEELPLKAAPASEPDYVPHKVILHRYSGGVPAWEGGPDTEVLLYEVIDGKHSWAEKDLDTCEEIWKFFSRYLR